MKTLSEEAIRSLDSLSKAQYASIQADNQRDATISTLQGELIALAKNVLELQTAREVQIRLNAQFKEAIGKTNMSKREKVSIWDFFKGK